MIEGFRFHHIGVACRNLEREIRAFAALGYERDGAIFSDPLQRVHCCFLKGPGPCVELLAPLDDSSPLMPWIEKGVKMYHQAYEVKSLSDAVARLEGEGAVLMSPPKPAEAFSGRAISFLMLPNLLLVELIESL